MLLNSQKNILKLLEKQKVLKYGNFVLKSGKESNFYFNCRDLADNFLILEEISNLFAIFIEEKVELKKNDYILGVPEGATLLGLKISEILFQRKKIGGSIFFPRVGEKKHGEKKNKFWVSGKTPKEVILVEDVITTGYSSLSFIKKLQEQNIKIKYLFCLLDRMEYQEDFKSFLQENNIKLFSVLSLEDFKFSE